MCKNVHFFVSSPLLYFWELIALQSRTRVFVAVRQEQGVLSMFSNIDDRIALRGGTGKNEAKDTG
jgi:hypothetical protein